MESTTITFALRKFFYTIYADEKRGHRYLYFEPDKKLQQVCTSTGSTSHSKSLIGRIVYQNENRVCFSHSLLVKITSDPSPSTVAEHWLPKGILLKSFTNEIYFYTAVQPFFESFRSLDDVLPKFHSSFVDSDRRRDNGVLIFENVESVGFRRAERRSFLDYAHLSLMMRKLGEFHAYSYKAKKANPFQFQALVPLSGDLSSSCFSRRQPELVARVRQALEPLRDDHHCEAALSRIEKMFQNLDYVIRQNCIIDGAKPSAILCHCSYTRDSVVFRYEKNVPVDLRIQDWQQCRLSSLATDIISPLYMDANQSTRDDHWDDLIEDYYAGLRETFPENEVLSEESMYEELKSRAAYVLLSVASIFKRVRPPQLCEELSQMSFCSTDPVTLVIKDMISRDFL